MRGGRPGNALRLSRRLGILLLALVVFSAVAAPLLAPHNPSEQFRDYMHAPPMSLHVRDDSGRWHLPFFYPLRLTSRLESRYDEDRSRLVPISRAGVRESGSADAAWFPLGTDSYGRDVLSRILYGARISLGLAFVAVLGSILIGGGVGVLAGYFGGIADEALMRLSEFIVVLPTVYLVLALRAAMPLVLSSAQVFALMAGIFTLVGWPYVARGVRGIVVSERRREYIEAARAAGGSHARIMFHHLLPATAGHLGAQATLLLPAFILAEATLSYVGLGFPDQTPTWGTLLQDATNVGTLAQFPWMLSSAIAVFVVVLGVNLAVGAERAGAAGWAGNVARRP